MSALSTHSLNESDMRPVQPPFQVLMTVFAHAHLAYQMSVSVSQGFSMHYTWLLQERFVDEGYCAPMACGQCTSRLVILACYCYVRVVRFHDHLNHPDDVTLSNRGSTAMPCQSTAMDVSFGRLWRRSRTSPNTALRQAMGGRNRCGIPESSFAITRSRTSVPADSARRRSTTSQSSP